MDIPSSALFQQYESDYCQKSTSVSKKLPALEGLAGGAAECLVLRTCLEDAFVGADFLHRQD